MAIFLVCQERLQTNVATFLGVIGEFCGILETNMKARIVPQTVPVFNEQRVVQRAPAQPQSRQRPRVARQSWAAAGMRGAETLTTL